MRLAGQAKAGFFAMANDAVRDVGRLLTPPTDSRPFTLLDPCCGEGQALSTLAQSVGCKESDLYAVELEDVRTERTAALIPDARLIGPASFLEVEADANRLSAAWVNPPYDNEIGGGFRVETSFANRATQMLQPGGLLLLVVPERLVATKAKAHVPAEAYDLTFLLLSRYEKVCVLHPRPEHRPYGEIVVAATKRARPLMRDQVRMGKDDLPDSMGVTSCDRRWPIPAGGPLTKWAKGGFTERELYEAVAGSELWRVTEAPLPNPPAEPLLPLAKGHLALMLASGFLDGIVRPEGEPPHVVRGTARKYLGEPEVSEEHDEAKGEVKTVTKRSERIRICVRAVSGCGTIKTLE